MRNAAETPIVPGFHPDPTICRVGDDYYLATSSFEFSPGVPLWHSTDLVNWELIGNILERPDQFEPGHAAASKGVYAPTLRHHDGRFWLITTDVSGSGGQLLVSAEDPRGPWSAPTIVHGLEGIDPDILWTDEGECFVTYCAPSVGLGGIAQARIDPFTGVALESPRLIWTGTGLAFPEAPHLYRHDDWWYLVIAEGGTERGHGVSVARGLHPTGPFESAPDNPIFSHRSTTHRVQNTGHADLVELGNGEWAAVYLGVRPRGFTPMFHVNGRETFLAGVFWAEGWPVFDQTHFDLPAADWSVTEDFSGVDALHPRWVSPGSAIAAFSSPSPDGGLTLTPSIAAGGTTSILAMRILNEQWRVTASFDLDGAVAALRVRLDELHWAELRAGDDEIYVVVCIGPAETRVGIPRAAPGSAVSLAIEATTATYGGPDDLRFLAGAPGEQVELARIDGRYLSTEVAAGFTGRVVGVRAVIGAPRVTRFEYEDRDAIAPV